MSGQRRYPELWTGYNFESPAICFTIKMSISNISVDKDGLLLTLPVGDGGTEVNAVDEEVVGELVVVPVVAHVNFHNFPLQQGGENIVRAMRSSSMRYLNTMS